MALFFGKLPTISFQDFFFFFKWLLSFFREEDSSDLHRESLVFLPSAVQVAMNPQLFLFSFTGNKPPNSLGGGAEHGERLRSHQFLRCESEHLGLSLVSEVFSAVPPIFIPQPHLVPLRWHPSPISLEGQPYFQWHASCTTWVQFPPLWKSFTTPLLLFILVFN